MGLSAPIAPRANRRRVASVLASGTALHHGRVSSEVAMTTLKTVMAARPLTFLACLPSERWMHQVTMKAQHTMVLKIGELWAVMV